MTFKPFDLIIYDSTIFFRGDHHDVGLIVAENDDQVSVVWSSKSLNTFCTYSHRFNRAVIFTLTELLNLRKCLSTINDHPIEKRQ